MAASFFRWQYFLYAHIVNKVRSAKIGEMRSLVFVLYASTDPGCTEHGMGYNRAVDMLKDYLNLWGEIKRSAPRHEERGEGKV